MKRLAAAILVLCFLAVSRGYCQVEEILAQGKVTDARTRKGVKATIEYSSIPTGSISGKFYDSTFSFSLFGSAKYKITAAATGYNPKTIIITPDDISADKKLIREIKLVPSGET